MAVNPYPGRSSPAARLGPWAALQWQQGREAGHAQSGGDLPWQRLAAWWIERGCPRDLLLLDHTLQSVETWAATHQDELADEERDFLEESRRASNAASRRERLSDAFRGMAAMFAIAAMLVVSLWIQARGEAESQLTARTQAEANLVATMDAVATAEADAAGIAAALRRAEAERSDAARELRDATSGMWAAASLSVQGRDPDLSILLAVMAVTGLNRQEPWGRATSIVMGSLYRSLGHVGWEQPVQIADVFSGASHYPAWPYSDGRLISAGDGNCAMIWDSATGRRLWTLCGHGGPVRYASWSPDGTSVASVGEEGIAIIWDADTGARRCTIGNGEDPLSNVSWAPEGSRLATTSCNGTVVIWDASSGNRLRTLLGRTGWPKPTSWSTDGSLVVSPSADGQVVIWDAKSGAVTNRLRIGAEEVQAAAIDPAGMVEVWSSSSASENAYSRWDPRTGAKLSVVWPNDAHGPGPDLVSILVRGDGPMYFKHTEDLVAFACSRVRRSLNQAEWELYVGRDIPYRGVCGDPATRR